MQLYDALCRWADDKSVQINLRENAGELAVCLDCNVLYLESSHTHRLMYEENLFYLSANRMGPEKMSRLDQTLTVGAQGQYLL